MFRIGIACCVAVGGSRHGAMAESPAERGSYLVNTIMACGNCHTPRDADGKPIADKAFSGGLTFNTPAFIATAPNITPDHRNRNRKLERCRDQARAGRGNAARSRPPRRRAAGGDHAGQFLQGAAAGRSRRHRRLSAHRQADPQRSRRTRSTRPRCAAIPIPTPKPDSARRCSPIRPGAAPISSPSAIAWNAIPPGRAASRISRPASAAAAGLSRRARERRTERPTASPPTSPRIPTAGIGAWTDAGNRPRHHPRRRARRACR